MLVRYKALRMQYVIHCNSCGLALTPPLEPLQYDSQLSFVDEEPMLPAGNLHGGIALDPECDLPTCSASADIATT